MRNELLDSAIFSHLGRQFPGLNLHGRICAFERQALADSVLVPYRMGATLSDHRQISQRPFRVRERATRSIADLDDAHASELCPVSKPSPPSKCFQPQLKCMRTRPPSIFCPVPAVSAECTTSKDRARSLADADRICAFKLEYFSFAKPGRVGCSLVMDYQAWNRAFCGAYCDEDHPPSFTRNYVTATATPRRSMSG